MTVLLQRPCNRVEIALGRVNLELRPVNGVGVDRPACLQPLEEPARLVRVAVTREIRLELWEGGFRKRITGNRDERTRGIVGFLLEVDDLLAVELDDVGLRALA